MRSNSVMSTPVRKFLPIIKMRNCHPQIQLPFSANNHGRRLPTERLIRNTTRRSHSAFPLPTGTQTPQPTSPGPCPVLPLQFTPVPLNCADCPVLPPSPKHPSSLPPNHSTKTPSMPSLQRSMLHSNNNPVNSTWNFSSSSRN